LARPLEHEPKPDQQRALTLLRDRIASFVFDADAELVRTEDADWGETLKKRYNYSGHLVAKAAPIVWAQVSSEAWSSGESGCRKASDGAHAYITLGPHQAFETKVRVAE